MSRRTENLAQLLGRFTTAVIMAERPGSKVSLRQRQLLRSEQERLALRLADALSAERAIAGHIGPVEGP